MKFGRDVQVNKHRLTESGFSIWCQMVAMTSLHAAKCCHLVSRHESSAGAYAALWRRSVLVSGLASINVVSRHWAWLVLGWVTACGRVNHLGM